MSAKPFRTRPGTGDDVVYETRRWWLRWLPNWIDLGWYAYANAASARNRAIQKLNITGKIFTDDLHKWAEAESLLAAEKKSSDESKHNHLGISDVFPLDPKRIKNMLPYVDEPENTFRKVINHSLVKQIMRQYEVTEKGAKKTDGKTSKQYDAIVSSVDAITNPEFFKNDNARQLLHWEPEKKKGSKNQDKSDGGKMNFKEARKHVPRYDDESQADWDKRVKEYINS